MEVPGRDKEREQRLGAVLSLGWRGMPSAGPRARWAGGGAAGPRRADASPLLQRSATRRPTWRWCSRGGCAQTPCTCRSCLAPQGREDVGDPARPPPPRVPGLASAPCCCTCRPSGATCTCSCVATSAFCPAVSRWRRLAKQGAVDAPPNCASTRAACWATPAPSSRSALAAAAWYCPHPLGVCLAIPRRVGKGNRGNGGGGRRLGWGWGHQGCSAARGREPLLPLPAHPFSPPLPSPTFRRVCERRLREGKGLIIQCLPMAAKPQQCAWPGPMWCCWEGDKRSSPRELRSSRDESCLATRLRLHLARVWTERYLHLHRCLCVSWGTPIYVDLIYS